MALEFPLPSKGNDIVGQVKTVKVKYKDTLADIGYANDMGYEEMVIANQGIDPWLPGQGTEVTLPAKFILPPGPRKGIVINLAEFRLYYYPKDRPVVYTYPLGIGREGWGSPVAHAKIIAKIANPAWYPPASIRAEHAAAGDPIPSVVPAGPDNPLGPFKMRLSLPGYLIHGSNKEFGIGMRVSHGCFRMLNANVLEVSKMIDVGTPVRIINEPYKFGRSGNKVFLEAHEPLDDKGRTSVVDKHSAAVRAITAFQTLNSNGYEDSKDINKVEVKAKNSDSNLSVDEVTSSTPATTIHLEWANVRKIIADENGIPAEVAMTERAVKKDPKHIEIF
ncbi:UNVERIFIED_CONTAM: hypothetical protein GTU68_058547 [Idotea baltica]|nr:hypothetical protein [Idotea baltica]